MLIHLKLNVLVNVHLDTFSSRIRKIYLGARLHHVGHRQLRSFFCIGSFLRQIIDFFLKLVRSFGGLK